MSSIPLLSADPTVQTKRRTRDEFRDKVERLEREQGDAMTKPSDGGIQSAARKLLAGEATAMTTRSLGDVERDLGIHREALRQAEQELAAAEAEASRQIANQQRPTYERILKAGAKAMRDVIAFIKAEAEFREEFMQKDIRFAGVMRPMPLVGRVEAGSVDTFEAWLGEYDEHYAA
jgi:hypothetical protein